MRYMLDANAFILLLTGHGAVGARAADCDEGELAISAIAFAEVAHGSAAGKAPAPEVLELAAERIPVLPFDHAAARAYAGLSFKRASFDRLIAAHALAAGAILVTANLGDFADVPDLRFEDWTQS
jgi:tRNA(fMet)-specific endonuclease VapC